MLKTFEKQTKPLAKIEKELQPHIINSLKKATKEKPISAHEISMCCELTQPRIRKIINNIRCNNLIKNLVASGNGYYITNSREEVRDYLMEQIRGRAEALAQLFNSYKDFSLEMEIKIKPKRRNFVCYSTGKASQKELFNS